MRANGPLSVIPYYGGKAKMSKFIADRLDYSCSTFITLFGGGARELLNKEPHDIEIYNEWDMGLCGLMETLSNPETAQELIDTLYAIDLDESDVEWYEEEFSRYKYIYESYKKDFEEQKRDKLKDFLKRKCGISSFKVNAFINYQYQLHLIKLYEILYNGEVKPASISSIPEDKVADCLHRLYSFNVDYYMKVENGERYFTADKAIEEIVFPSTDKVMRPSIDKFNKAMKDTSLSIEYDQLADDWFATRDLKECAVLEDPISMSETKISKMELSVATYLSYILSFSGMGKHIGRKRFKTIEQYQNHVLNLYECAERLNGVKVWRIDAMSFFRQHLYKDIVEPNNNILNDWLLNSDVMMFCDPSYISPVDEQKLLASINININDIDISKTTVSSFIASKKGDKLPKNLGKTYSRSFGYEEQEIFLRGIQQAKCKMMVCNYNLQLYDRYLTPEFGWVKEYYPTTTKVDVALQPRERLEVIWMNY